MTKTREQWLLQAVTQLKPLFKAAGEDLPEVRVSVGWPGGRGKKVGVIGQCWSAAAVKDRKPAIFISPALTHEDPALILSTLVHELVHATGKYGHRGEFSKLAAAVGLVKPWPATAASEPLKERLEKLAKKLGPFEHAQVRSGDILGIGPERPPVQSTRMLKVSCDTCGYTLRATAKWLSIAVPLCPTDEEVMTVEWPKEKE